MRTLLALLVALAPGIAGAALAQPAAPKPGYEPPGWPAAPTGGQLLGRLALLTAGTFGCAGVVLWLARRSPRTPALPEGAAPRVVARVPLAGRCALHLLQVDGAGFVVATDAGGLKAIHALAEPFEELVERGLAEVAEPAEPCALAPRRLSADELREARRRA